MLSVNNLRSVSRKRTLILIFRLPTDLTQQVPTSALRRRLGESECLMLIRRPNAPCPDDSEIRSDR